MTSKVNIEKLRKHLLNRAENIIIKRYDEIKASDWCHARINIDIGDYGISSVIDYDGIIYSSCQFNQLYMGYWWDEYDNDEKWCKILKLIKYDMFICNCNNPSNNDNKMDLYHSINYIMNKDINVCHGVLLKCLLCSRLWSCDGFKTTYDKILKDENLVDVKEYINSIKL